MPKAMLIVSQPGHATRQVESGEGETSIGSALDNSVCLEPDAGIARYHARVVRRGEDYWLVNRDALRATKVNGERVVSERKLADGDRVTLGGACLIEFYRCNDASHTPTTAAAQPDSHSALSKSGHAVAVSAPALSTRAAPAAPVGAHAGPALSPAVESAGGWASSSSRVVLAGAVGALLVTGVVAAVLFNPFGGGCRPSARIVTPLGGAALRSAATIRIEVEEAQCIRRVSYRLDGDEVAAATAAPFDATLDPRRLRRVSAGRHTLTATVETTDGAEIQQPDEVSITIAAADARPGVAPSPTSTPDDDGDETPTGGAASSVAAADVRAMAERLARQLSDEDGHVFEREMTARIQARAVEFASAAVTGRAARHRPVVVATFGRRGVSPLLGFVLAMSRSKFEEGADGAGFGLWRTPPDAARAYSQPGESPAALDSPQRAAEVAAAHLKDLQNVFGSDNFDLVVACYGCTLEEAGSLKQRVSAVPASERRNFWRMVERRLVSREQAERVVRFYAAGIVGENPRRFGLANERSLSSLIFF